MNRDIVDDLWSARLHDSDPWDVTIYERAANEIEHLRSLITAWVDADDDPEDIDGPYHAAWLALRKTVGR
jgi:hypothetical protein